MGANVRLLVGDSQRDGFPQIGDDDPVFIDGDHGYRGCSADLQTYFPRLAPGGIGEFARCPYGEQRLFQLAHCVEEASFASRDELRGEKRLWAVHEVETTVNFCPHNPALTWLLGGLNYQIEHHLFPAIPHTHYPRIARIVQRNCERHGVRYTAQPSLRAALRSHTAHLKTMGRLGLPVQIEMG